MMKNQFFRLNWKYIGWTMGQHFNAIPKVTPEKDPKTGMMIKEKNPELEKAIEEAILLEIMEAEESDGELPTQESLLGIVGSKINAIDEAKLRGHF